MRGGLRLHTEHTTSMITWYKSYGSHAMVVRPAMSPDEVLRGAVKDNAEAM